MFMKSTSNLNSNAAAQTSFMASISPVSIFTQVYTWPNEPSPNFVPRCHRKLTDRKWPTWSSESFHDVVVTSSLVSTTWPARIWWRHHTSCDGNTPAGYVVVVEKDKRCSFAKKLSVTSTLKINPKIIISFAENM